MARIALLTPAAHNPYVRIWGPAYDRLTAALAGAGLEVVSMEWPKAAEADVDAVLPLLAWGYHQDAADWLAMLDTLEARGLSTSVIDLSFAKPLDEELIRRTLASHEVCVTIEEGSIGGLGAHVLTLASDEGLIDAGLKLRTMRLPDVFQDQDSPQAQYDAAGLNAPQIVDCVLKALRHNSAGVEEAGARA